jgi:putative transcriptional regulator
LAQLVHVHPLDDTFGQNLLRRLRKERRMSQAEVARSVGLSRQSVNAIENGKCQPRLVVAYRLARLFGRPIEHVFQLDELETLELPGAAPAPRRAWETLREPPE